MIKIWICINIRNLTICKVIKTESMRITCMKITVCKYVSLLLFSRLRYVYTYNYHLSSFIYEQTLENRSAKQLWKLIKIALPSPLNMDKAETSPIFFSLPKKEIETIINSFSIKSNIFHGFIIARKADKDRSILQDSTRRIGKSFQRSRVRYNTPTRT